VLFVAVAFYLVIGNLTRVVPLPGLSNDVPLTEFIVYAAAMWTLLRRPEWGAKVVQWMAAPAMIILASGIYGMLVNGPALLPLLYPVRLVLLLGSGVVVGIGLGEATGPVETHLRRITYLYVVAFGVGFAILVLFPDSTSLWSTLQRYGVEFHGDPHVRRLVSTYLDPNYFAAIAVFPISISLVLYASSFRLRDLVIGFIGLAALMLTKSRSGLGTLVLTLVPLMAIILGRPLSRRGVRPTQVVGVGLTVAVALIGGPLFLQPLAATIHRIATIQHDASARARLHSFEFGDSIFLDRPLFGIGYNYLLKPAEKARGTHTVDSSVQATLISFGLIGTLTLLSLVVTWGLRTLARVKRFRARHPGSLDARVLHLAFRAYTIYVLATVVFASLFNNVLYYPFWLLPMTALGAYFFVRTKRTSISDAGTRRVLSQSYGEPTTGRRV